MYRWKLWTILQINRQPYKNQLTGGIQEKRNSGKSMVLMSLSGKREGYYFYDVDGKKLMNAHLNGGTYNLGHRNPEVCALVEGTNYFDMVIIIFHLLHVHS